MNSELFITVLNMSLAGGCAALAVMLIRLLLRRAPRLFSYLLWGVVFFRLVCPFSFESALSAFMPAPQPIPQDIVYAAQPSIQSEIPPLDAAVNSLLEQPGLAAAPYASVNPIQLYLAFGEGLWMAGMAGLLLYGLVTLLRLRRTLDSAVLAGPGIYETDRVVSPFVLGLFRPRIYLPLGLTGEERAYVLEHERAHIRRGDHMVKLAAWIVLAVHWFNPLVWAAFVLFSRDMELSCDEMVMKRAGKDIRAGYSASLLGISMKRNGLPVPLAFGETGVKARIRNVLNYRRPALWVTAAAVAAVAAAVLMLAGSRPAAPAGPDAQPPPAVGEKAPDYPTAFRLYEQGRLTRTAILRDGETATRAAALLLAGEDSGQEITNDLPPADAYLEVSIGDDGSKVYYIYEAGGETWVEHPADYRRLLPRESYDELMAFLEESGQPGLSIRTVGDDPPLTCQFGVEYQGGKDTLELLGALEQLQGFRFREGETSHRYVQLVFEGDAPREIYLRTISQESWQEEYPIDSADYRIKVPNEPGVHNFIAELHWEGGEIWTVYFSITVTGEKDIMAPPPAVAMTIEPYDPDNFEHQTFRNVDVDNDVTVPLTIEAVDGGGNPVSNLYVSLQDGGSPTLVTDSQGRATARVILDYDYNLSLADPFGGSAPQEYRVQFHSVPAGAAARFVWEGPTPRQSMAGHKNLLAVRVLDPAGNPLAGYNVGGIWAKSFLEEHDGKRPDTGFFNPTDYEGRYYFTGLEPQAYVLEGLGSHEVDFTGGRQELTFTAGPNGEVIHSYPVELYVQTPRHGKGWTYCPIPRERWPELGKLLLSNANHGVVRPAARPSGGEEHLYALIAADGQRYHFYVREDAVYDDRRRLDIAPEDRAALLAAAREYDGSPGIPQWFGHMFTGNITRAVFDGLNASYSASVAVDTTDPASIALCAQALKSLAVRPDLGYWNDQPVNPDVPAGLWTIRLEFTSGVVITGFGYDTALYLSSSDRVGSMCYTLDKAQTDALRTAMAEHPAAGVTPFP